MKVLLLNTSDIDGGAARAAHRLHQGLLGLGVDSRMLVQSKTGDDPNVLEPSGTTAKALSRLRPRIDSLPLRTFTPVDKYRPFSTSWLPERLAARVKSLAPDIVHLHWVNGGFARIETLANLPRPMVWTLHDMWAFTGGCHYDAGCGRYREHCGKCPQLGSGRDRDASRRTLRRKRASWKGNPFTLVTPSRWLAGCARTSPLFADARIEVIPNGLDLDRYRPHGKDVARDILGLPRDRNLIAFGAMSMADARKGFRHLQAALLEMARHWTGGPTEVVVFGAGRPASPPELGFPIRYTGRLHDDASLSLLYSAVDAFVCSSEEDNLPNTVAEALACGTPCAAFRVGGLPDLIDDGVNGRLTAPFDAAGMAEAIASLLGEPSRRAAFSAAARKKAEAEYGLEKCARAYARLYGELHANRT